MGLPVLFIILLCCIGYVSVHIWLLLPLSVMWRWLAVALFVLLFAMLFATLFRVIDSLPLGIASFCYDVGTSSVIVAMHLLLVFLLLDIGRLLRIVPRQWLLSNGITTCVIGSIIVILLFTGNIIYNRKVREDLHITTSKSLVKPLRILMASDLHIGYGNRRAELARWVDMINAEKPDIVLFAGDIIDMSHRPLHEEKMADELRRITAPVYACPGNHEFFGGIDKAEAFYRDAAITLLRDSVIEIGGKSVCCEDSIANEGGIYLICRDDRMNFRRKPLERLTEGLDGDRFMLLLDHQPYHLEQTERAGIDFQFSGHTHRGQIWPISLITDNVYECSFGYHRRGDTEYYISSGLGIWGGKYRIGTRSEYVVLTIDNVKEP